MDFLRGLTMTWLWLNTNVLGENVGFLYAVRSELKVHLGTRWNDHNGRTWLLHWNSIRFSTVETFCCENLKKGSTAQHVKWSQNMQWCTLRGIIFWDRRVNCASQSYLLTLRKINLLFKITSIIYRAISLWKTVVLSTEEYSGI